MSTSAVLAARKNPFPGLRPFNEDEEHLFFGRESQVDAMVDKLASTHFLAVVGTSGSGKSSLVNCGLRPALHRGLMARAGTAWRMAQFRPGSDPIGAMAHALARDGVLFRDFQAGGLTLPEIIETTLRMSSLGLIDIFEQAHLDEKVNLLVVVDQFEELFRYRQLGADKGDQASSVTAEATTFVNLLLEAGAQRTHPIYVVLTMRSDFLGDCAQFPGLAESINAGQYLVPRLTRDERRAAISGPISVGGAEILPVLMTRLVNDVGDNPDQLSILQHALNRTWARWENEGRAEGPLDLAIYEEIGTMAHALDQHAEKAYAELRTDRQRQICERLFKALTDKATDPRGVRRPTTLGTLCALADATEPEVTEVIDVFRQPSRSFLMPPSRDALHNDTVIDISHESLMRVWQRLNTWADEEADSAGRFRRLADTAVLHAAGKAGLWRDPDLQLALDWRDRNEPNETWAARYHSGFTATAQFLEESRVARDDELAEREEQRRRALEAEQEKAATQARNARRMLWAAVFSGALAVAAVVLGLSARKAKIEAEAATQEAQTQASLAHSGRLISLSGNERPDRAALLAIEAWQAADTSDSRNNLLRTLQSQPMLDTYLHHGQGAHVWSVAVSPDGTLASGGTDKMVRLWKLEESGATPLHVVPHDDEVWCVAFGPDGTLASSGKDGKVQLWKLGESGATPLLKEPLVHGDWVRTLAFSPDGTLLAAGGGGEIVDLWKIGPAGATPLFAMPLNAYEGAPPPDENESNYVTSVAFHPDGTLLAAGNNHGTIRLWQIGKTSPTQFGEPIPGHTGWIRSIAFGPGGTFATGGDEGTVRLWKIGDAGATPLGEPLIGHDGWVRGVAFREGIVASAGTDKTVRLWKVGEAGATPLNEPLRGHDDAVWSVAFAPDGTLVSAGSGGAIPIWKPGKVDATPLGEVVKVPDGESNCVAISQNGTLLAMGEADGTVRLWTLEKSSATPLGEEGGVLSGTGASPVSSVAFGVDGTMLATGDEDGAVRLWKLGKSGATPLLESPLNKHGKAVTVTSVGIDPAGNVLASGDEGGTVWLWTIGNSGAAPLFDAPLTKHQDKVTSVALGPNGILATADFGPRKVVLWRIGKSAAKPIYEKDGQWMNAFAFGPNGVLAGGGWGAVQLWKIEQSGAKLFGEPLKGHNGDVNSVSVSPDGTLASGGMDGTVRLWKLGESGATPLGDALKGHEGEIWSVAFAPGGTLASSGKDGTVWRWDIEIELWRAALCRRASRNFSQVEWRNYMGAVEPYRSTCSTHAPGE